MFVPKELFTAFEKLKKSQLVMNPRTYGDDALSYFEEWLNKAQPTDGDGLRQQKDIKSLYNGNKRGFINMIRGTQNERLILWTEAKSIAYLFGLKDVAYIKWDRETRTYAVTPFVSRQHKDDFGREDKPLHPVVQKKTSSKPSTDEESESTNINWGDA